MNKNSTLASIIFISPLTLLGIGCSDTYKQTTSEVTTTEQAVIENQDVGGQDQDVEQVFEIEMEKIEQEKEVDEIITDEVDHTIEAEEVSTVDAEITLPQVYIRPDPITVVPHSVPPPPPEFVPVFDIQNGKLVVIDIEETDQLEEPEYDAISAVGWCQRMILDCINDESGYAEQVDGCVIYAPVCPTDTPWKDTSTSCCPQTCIDAYENARKVGKEWFPAWKEAFFSDAPNCFPGVDALTGGF